MTHPSCHSEELHRCVLFRTDWHQLFPTGIVSFLNTAAANQSVATAAIDPTTLVRGFVPSPISPLPSASLRYVATGYFNGDGIADFASVSPDGNVAVHIGIGDGAFQTEVDYPVSSELACIVVATSMETVGRTWWCGQRWRKWRWR